MVDSIIRFFPEGPAGAHQDAKAFAPKIFRTFYCLDLKKDVRFYIASCLACQKYLHLNNTLIDGLPHIEVGRIKDCIAMDIVGGKD